MSAYKFNTFTRIFYLFLAVLISAYSFNAQAQSQPRFLGYFANDDRLSENFDHTNITFIGVFSPDRSIATSRILSNLAEAQNLGVRAIVAVKPFVFVPGTSSDSCPVTLESNSSSYFATLVNTLISQGYLVPNDPDASTVAAFYPVDEPELCGLKDQGGNAHPALANAINTIISNPNTSNFPIAVIASSSYGQAIKGLRLFDWAGMDWYQKSTPNYLAEFSTFTSALDPS